MPEKTVTVKVEICEKCKEATSIIFPWIEELPGIWMKKHAINLPCRCEREKSERRIKELIESNT
ncbi:MAG: hypothetical protein WC878_07315 [Candidatus Paceibacterota bacterium]|jgi:hypothetical protein